MGLPLTAKKKYIAKKHMTNEQKSIAITILMKTNEKKERTKCKMGSPLTDEKNKFVVYRAIQVNGGG